MKDAFHGQEVWGRTLSIQFSSGNPLDSNPRRDRNTDLRGDADGVRALDERGRGDSPSNRGSKNRSNSGGYSDGRGGDGGGGGGGREGDTGMNRSNRCGNVDSNDRGRDMPQHEDKRSSDGSGYQYQNQKRLNVPDVIDRECRTRDNFGNRNGNGAGNEHGIGDSNCREGNRLKSNFINRSRSRDRGRDRGDRRNSNDNDNGNGNGNGNGYGFNNDRSGNNNNNINNSSGRIYDRNGQDVDVGNTSNQKFDMPSISVIALPFGVSGGRFLYEHPDGRREYVEAMLSSSNSSSSSCHAVSGSGSPNNSRGRGRGSIRGHSNPRQNQYSSVSGEKR